MKIMDTCGCDPDLVLDELRQRHLGALGVILERGVELAARLAGPPRHRLERAVVHALWCLPAILLKGGGVHREVDG